MTTDATGGKAPGALRAMLERGDFIVAPGVHDLGGGDALAELFRKGFSVRHPELTFATLDHMEA